MLLGCNDPTYTSQQLLQQEQSAAREAASIDPQRDKIESQIELFKSAFSAYDREAIAAAIPILYAEEAFLNDRIHSVTGRAAIAEYFDGTFGKMHQSEFQIHETLYGQQDAYLRWLMRIQLSEEAEFMEFMGMTQLRFNQGGEIIYHQDYWDFSELMGQIGAVRWLVNLVKNRA